MNARLCQRPERISGRTVSNSPCFSLETRNPGMVNIGVHGKGLWGEMFLFPFFPFRLKKENVSNLLATSLSAWIYLRDVNRKQKSAKCVIKSAGMLLQGLGDRAAWAGGAWLYWMPTKASKAETAVQRCVPFPELFIVKQFRKCCKEM